jgi:hypothetical protein
MMIVADTSPINYLIRATPFFFRYIQGQISPFRIFWPRKYSAASFSFSLIAFRRFSKLSR